MKYFKYLPFICLFVFVVAVFRPFFFGGKLPIPADTIVGLYHPWRDAVVDKYPSGVPFKNFLITDPVRQQYPWRELAMESLKQGEWLRWNPYSFAGTPLLANIQTATFYPLNFLYWLLPFSWGWSFQVILQVVFGGLFMILYLRYLKLRPEAQAIGALAWVGSGFFVAWLEWNTIVQAAIWLPLLLLSVDKIVSRDKRWSFIFVFSLAASFLAGHIQIFGYVLLLTLAYIGRRFNRHFLGLFIATAILTAVQWVPLVTLLQESLRTVPISDWQKPGWFLPWQNLVQFLVPDFFGNPATLNYFGIWNYGEFIGFIGVVPLIFAIFALCHPKSTSGFWIVVLAISLLFALPNFIAELPFRLSLPLVSTFQPTRLLVTADLALAILAAFGLHHFLDRKTSPRRLLFFLISFLGCLWLVAWKLNLPVSQKNLLLPTGLLLAGGAALLLPRKFTSLAVIALLVLTLFDLSRFAGKFESFSSPDFLYPETGVTKFLTAKAKNDVFRVVALDDQIFPPNFAVHYKIQMISGYDSLVLTDYAGMFGSGSRIIVPKNLDDPNFSLLGVRYFLSFTDLDPKKYSLVYQEGQTKIFEAKKVLPRAAFTYPVGGEAKIISYTENEVTIQTYNQTDGLLTLFDAYYPDWQADIDGKLTVVTQSDTGGFRSVAVPGGSHLVRFKI